MSILDPIDGLAIDAGGFGQGSLAQLGGSTQLIEPVGEHLAHRRDVALEGVLRQLLGSGFAH